MMFVRKKVLLAGLALSALAVPLAALASHGKVGLWEVTSHMDMPGMNAQIPPEALARMQAMGVHMPNSQTFSSQHCMTAADIAVDKPPPIHNAKDCTMTNMTHDAHNFAADMVCTGDMVGQGHLSVTYDGDEHYAGTYVFKGSAHGHPANVTNSFEGKWISADCGSVK